MEYSAIHHYMEKRYCYAIKNGRFVIRIETKKNDMDKIILHYRDKYLPVEHFDTRQQVEMERVASGRFNDYYEAVIDIDVICLRYYFEITDREGNTTYYGNYDFYDENITNIDKMFDLPQNLREEEQFDIPSWAENKVVYQIFPSRYATTENVEESLWYKSPVNNMDNLHGNLRGIINHLPHIKELGADVIYMTPIFLSESMHKYDTIDYYKIDPSFGTEDDLKELVNKAHEMGMRVILDGVFNHTSPKFFAFKDIKENGEKSPYINWYYIKDFPIRYGSRTEKPNYKSFAYYGGMPKLNLNNTETADYFINVGKYWVKECHIDGWRLDVGDEISHFFWKKFRKALKKDNPDTLIIGEIWHYAGDFLEGDEWDTVMNYQFYLAVQDFVAKETMTASEFVESLDFMRGNLNRKVYPVLWNLIDSHDTARFTHVCGENREKIKLAAALQLLSTGMAMIYYGDEYAMKGGGDPDCRRGMVWDEKYQDKEIFEWYKSLIKIRKEHPVITKGELIKCRTDDESGTIIETRQLDGEGVIMIFHGKREEITLKEYAGKKNILTGERFDGKLGAYDAVVLIN